MITVETNFPIAWDSDDHHHPDGVHFDNHCNPAFVDSIQNYFQGRKINYLDLGCAGGGLVSKMIDLGHNCVGLEGSDHCLNIKPEVINKLGAMPAGYQNWQKYGNKNLFTCDITYEYEIRENNQLMQFDFITCLDVMEHFYEERIDTFLQMVTKHLKPNGIFTANVALFSVLKDKILAQGKVEYHKSLFPTEKWLDMMSKHLREVPYPFSCTNRNEFNKTSEYHLIYAGVKL